MHEYPVAGWDSLLLRPILYGRIHHMNWLRRVCFLLLPELCVADAFAGGKHIEIGYTNCLAVPTCSPSLMVRATQLKWYFTHASVGANMMDGITDLHEGNSNYYRLQSISATAQPPTVTQSGIVYEHQRGNPGWRAKIDKFHDCVSNGWRFPLVNIAMNKLCYIDQNASLKYYLNSMTNLEARYPQTVFVYSTIPLMASADGDNFLRNRFNDRLREWTRNNGRVLFDIADIEAHDPNGAPCVFTWRGQACQRLSSNYTTDGGHLNPTGRQLVARGFYALAAAIAEFDRGELAVKPAEQPVIEALPRQSGGQY